MKKNKTQIHMLADAQYFLMGIIAEAIITCGCAYVIVIGWDAPWMNGDTPINVPHLTFYVFGAVWLGFAVIWICIILPRMIIVITLSAECVRFRVLFHKTIEIPWKDFKNILPATYYHGSPLGVGYYPDYLVLAKRRVEMSELRNVNTALVDEEFLKIRITKRSYRKLEAILPPYPKLILEKYYAGKYGGK